MYTALEDITIDKIDFQWIKNTQKVSHLKRAIRVIELDGNFYPELKQQCYKRIQQIDPSQKRLIVTNNISSEMKKQLENQLLQWEQMLMNKENNGKKQNQIKDKNVNLEDYQAYFNNQSKLETQDRKSKLAEAQRVKGNQAIKSKDFQEAITYYTNSINLDPKIHLSYCNRALAYLKTKQFQKCIDDCQSTLKIDNKYVKAYHRKAKALIGLKKKVQAYRCLQQGARIQPNNSELTKQLKELREQMSPDEIRQLDSNLISKSQFKKITIQEDSDEDND